MHRCYRDSLAATGTVATMLATHRALHTWKGCRCLYRSPPNSACAVIEGGLPGEKIVVKPNFVYPDPGPGSGDGNYAVFVGRLSAEKGIDTFLAAWKKLGPSVPLKIVGDGPLAAVVEEAVASNPGIEWLKSQPLDVVYKIVGKARFLVVTSQCYESSSASLSRRLPRALRCSTSRLGGLASILDHGRTGLHFEPGNPADLAAKVQQFLAEPQELNRMRQAARQECERNYTADANHRALMAIYQRAGIKETANSKQVSGFTTHHSRITHKSQNWPRKVDLFGVALA